MYYTEQTLKGACLTAEKNSTMTRLCQKELWFVCYGDVMQEFWIENGTCQKRRDPLQKSIFQTLSYANFGRGKTRDSSVTENDIGP